MEYAQAASLQPGLNQAPIPELGRLKAASERIYHATGVLESFIGRFHGQPQVPQNGTAGQPVADNYRNDIDSLFGVIERLEAVTAQLGTIG